MALVVPNNSEVTMLQYILNITSPENLVIHLYANDVTPDETSVTATFTEVTGGGYASISLTTGNWTIVASNPSQAEHTEVVWTFTGSVGLVYGYYVTRATGGEANVVFTAGSQRGGKGTPKPRRRYKVTPQRTVHYYHAEAYFEHTKQLGGEAITSFVPARYSFIKSLPPLPARPETPLYDIAALSKVSDSEFLKVYNDLYGRSITPSVFAYKSDGEMSVGGSAKNTHIDFTKVILDQDEDLLMTDMLSSTSELMPTRRSMNKKLLRMMLEDEELLDLELL